MQELASGSEQLATTISICWTRPFDCLNPSPSHFTPYFIKFQFPSKLFIISKFIRNFVVIVTIIIQFLDIKYNFLSLLHCSEYETELQFVKFSKWLPSSSKDFQNFEIPCHSCIVWNWSCVIWVAGKRFHCI